MVEDIFSFDKCISRKTCEDNKTVVMAVKMSIEKVKIICIHPQNDSLPVFTMKIDNMAINYNSF
jgi:hypothetical protein